MIAVHDNLKTPWRPYTPAVTSAVRRVRCAAGDSTEPAILQRFLIPAVRLGPWQVVRRATRVGSLLFLRTWAYVGGFSFLTRSRRSVARDILSIEQSNNLLCSLWTTPCAIIDRAPTYGVPVVTLTRRISRALDIAVHLVRTGNCVHIPIDPRQLMTHPRRAAGSKDINPRRAGKSNSRGRRCLDPHLNGAEISPLASAPNLSALREQAARRLA
jgi:hypothetical protein